MTKKYYEDRERDIRARWFPNHIAIFSTGEVGKTSLIWRQPNNSNYFCRYIIEGQVLIVYGDIGGAIYQWGQNISWEFLAGLDLDYFAGKCQASPHGRGYKTWGGDVAEHWMKEHFEQNPAEREAFNKIQEENFQKPDNFSVASSNHEWVVFLNEHGYAIFGGNYFELWDIGDVIDIQCQGHLIAIKMAWAQADGKQRC